MNIGEMFVRVGADTSGLDRGLRNAENRVRGFGNAVGRVNLDRLRGPLTTVAAQLTGLNPALGTLSTTLLSMAAGGGVAVGAIAGFAAIGAAMRKMGEDARAADKAVQDAIKRLQDLATKRAVNLPVFNDFVESQTRRGELVRQAEPLRASVAAREALGALGNVFGALDKERAQLAALEAEIAKLDRAAGEATNVLRGTPQAIDGITVSVERLKRASLSDFNGPGLPIAGEQARAALAASRATPLPEWVKKALSLNLQPMSQGGAGGGALDNVVGKFRDAVDSFTGGVKDMVKGAFSTGGLANIGANLASQGISFLSGKLIDGLRSLFDRQSESERRLAQALEQNTKALQAGSDFLSKLVSGAGLSDFAKQASEAVQGLLSSIAVQGGAGKNLFTNLVEAMLGFTTGDAREQRRIEVTDQLIAISKLLGISLDQLNTDTLRQLGEQLSKATSGLGDLADVTNRATEALSNVPEIWNAALGRFRALRSAASGMAASGGYVFTGSIILPNVRNGADFYREVEKEAIRRTARGGAPTISDANIVGAR